MFLVNQEQAMIAIEFTTEQIDILEYELYHYPDPKIQKKLEVVYKPGETGRTRDISSRAIGTSFGRSQDRTAGGVVYGCSDEASLDDYE